MRGVAVRFAVAAAVLVAAAASMLTASAGAQTFPSRPIKVIIPASAGGTQDVFMRALGEDLRKRFGHALVIDNRPGGNFNIGARACAESSPDGYTICMLPNEALVYNQFLFRKLPYDPVKDFAPITNPFFSTQAIVANADLKVKSLAELAALSKAKPKSLSYIAPGLPLWVFMENFKKLTGADMVRVPFRGGGETANGVLSGTTPVAFSGLSNWAAYLQAGTVVGLAVDSPRRLPMLPDVPTIGELGYKIDITRVYFGIVAPAGTPRPIVERLRNEMAEVINDSDFREKHMTSRGHEPVANTPDEFARFLALDRLLSRRIVNDAGVQPQ
ncbi:MAG: tripartite tricarboxylate transporter substrate binding protein [Xanthobacteraceae bacterium]|nr:tripartite tricarboxylate transporter substrate binding protein [Xanthobacteraceae bacterium]